MTMAVLDCDPEVTCVLVSPDNSIRSVELSLVRSKMLSMYSAETSIQPVAVSVRLPDCLGMSPNTQNRPPQNT